MTVITINLADDAEASACLALLPEARGLAAELLIARKDGDFVGAAAIFWRSWSAPDGFPVIVHVLPSERRQGIGRRLLSQAAELSQGETSGLWSMQPMSETDPASVFMRACGFSVQRRQHYFEASVGSLLGQITPTIQRLRSRGRIPEDVRIVPIKDVPLDEVAWLISSEFGGGPLRAMNGLLRRGYDENLDVSDRSYAVVYRDGLVGIVLWRADGEWGVIDANIVSPAYRRGWTNLIQLEAGLNRGRAEGLEKFRFYCDETVKDTIALARRCAANETQRRALYYYTLNTD